MEKTTQQSPALNARDEVLDASRNAPVELSIELLEQVGGGDGEEIQTPRQGW